MEMKMMIVCVCGTRLNVSMAQYLKMRCPKCQTMLAEEIERQASRNSKAVWDITAWIANERMHAKRWGVSDEVIARLLCKAEIESHGGEWPPKEVAVEEEVVVQIDNKTVSAHTSPLIPDLPEQPKRKMSVKLKKKRGRR